MDYQEVKQRYSPKVKELKAKISFVDSKLEARKEMVAILSEELKKAIIKKNDVISRENEQEFQRIQIALNNAQRRYEEIQLEKNTLLIGGEETVNNLIFHLNK